MEATRKGQGFTVALYNPLAWPRRELVRIPITSKGTGDWTVSGVAQSTALGSAERQSCFAASRLPAARAGVQEHGWDIWHVGDEHNTPMYT